MPVFGTLTEPRVRSLQHLDVQRSDVNLDQRKSCCESLTHHPAGFDGERGCMTCWPANCSTGCNCGVRPGNPECDGVLLCARHRAWGKECECFKTKCAGGSTRW